MDILRNEKKVNVYIALNTCPIYVVSQALTMSWRVSISIIFFNETLKGLCRIKAFWKYLILGSSKGSVEKPNRATLVLTADKWLAMAVAEYLFVYKN